MISKWIIIKSANFFHLTINRIFTISFCFIPTLKKVSICHFFFQLKHTLFEILNSIPWTTCPKYWIYHNHYQLVLPFVLLVIFVCFFFIPAACPVNFEFMNYTIITSRCKGPRYPANLCCDAFKDFACPYSVELNDLTNECSSTMFSYINLYGNYPPGLFSSLCRDDKVGLICPALAPGAGRNSVGADTNSSHNIRSPSILFTFISGFLIFVFRLFWSLKIVSPCY